MRVEFAPRDIIRFNAETVRMPPTDLDLLRLEDLPMADDVGGTIEQ